MNDMPIKYQFGCPIGPWRKFFAWRPVRAFDGTWVWLRYAHRRKIIKHSYLDGPDWEFWCVDDTRG